MVCYYSTSRFCNSSLGVTPPVPKPFRYSRLVFFKSSYKSVSAKKFSTCTIYRRSSTDLNSNYKNDKSYRIWKIGLQTKLESPQIVGKLIFSQTLGSNKKVHRFDRKCILLNQFHSGMPARGLRIEIEYKVTIKLQFCWTL